MKNDSRCLHRASVLDISFFSRELVKEQRGEWPIANRIHNRQADFGKKKKLAGSCPHFSWTTPPLYFLCPHLLLPHERDLSLDRNKRCFPIEGDHYQNHTKKSFLRLIYREIWARVKGMRHQALITSCHLVIRTASLEPLPQFPH